MAGEDDTDMWYPYEFAIANLILLTLGIGALFDNATMELRSRMTATAALVVVAGMLAIRTRHSGYLPWDRSTERLRPDQRNLPGWSTIVIVAASALMIPFLWFR